MPRRSTRPKKDKATRLNPDQLDDLITGHVLNSGHSFEDEIERRKAWEENKGYLLSLIGQKIPGGGFFSCGGYSYGSRPRAFWNYEVKEARRIVEQRSLPSGETYPIYESEFVFLKRSNLLFPGEELEYHRIQRETKRRGFDMEKEHGRED